MVVLPVSTARLILAYQPVVKGIIDETARAIDGFRGTQHAIIRLGEHDVIVGPRRFRQEHDHRRPVACFRPDSSPARSHGARLLWQLSRSYQSHSHRRNTSSPW